MFQLVYCSDANPDLTSEDITNILNTSVDFNFQKDITGCLVYYRGEFIQILEGNKQEVQELYQKIKKDKRHSNVVLISEESNEDRIFPNWTMLYYELTKANTDKISEEIFVENLNTLSALVEKPTQTIYMFWFIIRQFITNNTTTS